MKAKNTLVALFSILIGFSFCNAAPAFPGLVHSEQPDGTSFYMKNFGDEDFNFRTDDEGRLIIRDDDSKWWFFAEISDDLLVPTSRKVGVDIPEPSKSFFKEDLLEILYEHEPIGSGFDIQSITKSSQTLGTFTIPIVLINYSDTQVTYTAEDFEKVLFGNYPDLSPNGSMRDYFLEVSYGLLELEGVVLGWYQAENERDYYSDKADVLLREAIEHADRDIDFSLFPVNEKGEVEIVAIIHQGMGQEFSGDPDDIWSHMGYLSPAYVSDDGVKIRRYTIQPERIDWPEPGSEKGEPVPGIATIGVISHELGHVLGLPDLYDYTLKTWGIGDWGLMGYGCWNYIGRPGDSPSHMTAWSKLELAWMEVSEIHGSFGIFLLESSTHSGIAFTFTNPENSHEYFLMETRSLEGFDSALPGEGLLIYHVDSSMNSNDYGPHFPRRLLRVLQADGEEHLDNPDPENRNRGDEGDPFPGSAGASIFSDFSEPDSRWYDGSESNLRIEGIDYESPTISFAKLPSEKYDSRLVVIAPKLPASGKAEILIKILETEPIGQIELEFHLRSTVIKGTDTSPSWKDDYVGISEDRKSAKTVLSGIEGLPHAGFAGVLMISVEGQTGTYPEVSLVVSVKDPDGNAMSVLTEYRHHLADINQDGIVDDTDISLFRNSYGKSRGDVNWDEISVLCDLNNDDTVGTTIYDLAIFALHSSLNP